MLGNERAEIRTAGATGHLLEVPQYFSIVDGAVTQIAWFDHNSLAIGTSFGYLHLWAMAPEVSKYGSLEDNYGSHTLATDSNIPFVSTPPSPWGC